MCLTIVLEWHLLPESNLKIRFNAPSPGFVFQQQECTTSRREFPWKNFYSARIKFSPRMLSRFCSRQDSRRGPGEEFLSWWDPGEYRFLGGIPPEIRGENFSQEGSRRENGPPRRDPGRIPVTAGNLGGIPPRSRYLFYKGYSPVRDLCAKTDKVPLGIICNNFSAQHPLCGAQINLIHFMLHVSQQ